MSDSIDRQGAIESVRQAVIAGYGSDHGLIDSDVIYEVLEELPSVNVEFTEKEYKVLYLLFTIIDDFMRIAHVIDINGETFNSDDVYNLAKKVGLEDY